jgi:hypothetical protein
VSLLIRERTLKSCIKFKDGEGGRGKNPKPCNSNLKKEWDKDIAANFLIAHDI